MRTSQNPAYRFLKVNKGRSPLRIAPSGGRGMPEKRAIEPPAETGKLV
mgnify:FL=1